MGELWLNDYLGFSIIYSPDEVWLEQIAYEAWFVQCYSNLQWDLNPWIHSLVQGAALDTCVWGLFHITILQNSVLVLAGGFEPPKAQRAGDLQSPGIDHYPKLAYKNFSILTHTMEKSASQHNWLLVIILFVEYNIIQFSLYSFTTLPI